MTEHVMHFVGPKGDIITLDHIVPHPGELRYSTDGGKTLQPFIFTPLHGAFHTNPRDIEVEYLIWESEDDKKARNDAKAELLVHHNSVITYKGVTYNIDKSRRPRPDDL